MARNQRRFHCSPDAVFDVLSDGWLYPSWVVGASRMRDVDEHWPAPGSKIQHSVGVWPALLNDTTSCEVWDPPHRMVLLARGRPIGKARVTITVTPVGSECVVTITEHAVSGPATLVPSVIEDAAFIWRNGETLHRLAYLAEGRSGRSGTTADKEQADEESSDAPAGAPAGDQASDGSDVAGT